MYWRIAASASSIICRLMPGTGSGSYFKRDPKSLCAIRLFLHGLIGLHFSSMASKTGVNFVTRLPRPSASNIFINRRNVRFFQPPVSAGSVKRLIVRKMSYKMLSWTIEKKSGAKSFNKATLCSLLPNSCLKIFHFTCSSKTSSSMASNAVTRSLVSRFRYPLSPPSTLLLHLQPGSRNMLADACMLYSLRPVQRVEHNNQ